MLITPEAGIKWTIKTWNKKGGSFHFEAVPLNNNIKVEGTSNIGSTSTTQKAQHKLT